MPAEWNDSGMGSSVGLDSNSCSLVSMIFMTIGLIVSEILGMLNINDPIIIIATMAVDIFIRLMRSCRLCSLCIRLLTLIQQAAMLAAETLGAGKVVSVADKCRS